MSLAPARLTAVTAPAGRAAGAVTSSGRGHTRRAYIRIAIGKDTSTIPAAHSSV